MEAQRLIRKLVECLNKKCPVAVVTVIDVKGSAPREVGAKMLVFEDGRIEETVGGGLLEALAIKSARDALRKRSSHLETFELKPDGIGTICGGTMEVFIDVF